MGPDAIALVLVASLLHAFWNARTHGGDDRQATLAISYSVGIVVLLPWIILNPPTSLWWLVLLSGGAHGLYLLSLAAAYDRGALATTYPIARGSAPLFVAAAATWWLDQTPTALTILGAISVAGGLLLIGNVGWKGGERQSLLLALTVGMFVGSYTLIDARGADEVNGFSFFATASIVAVSLVLVVGRVSPTRIRQGLRTGVMVGIASTSAYALIVLAYTRADAANIATLRSSSILFGLAFVPRTLTPKLVAGALLTVTGTTLVTL